MKRKIIYLSIAATLAMPQLLQAQNVGIGTTTPTAPLDVNGTVRIRGGAPAAGKVLTSDANGVASWQVNSSGNGIGFVATPLSSISQDFPNDVDSTINFVTLNGVGGVGFNDGGSFNNTNNSFTAPSSGFYQFHFTLKLDQYMATQNGTITIMFNHNGSSNYHHWVSTFMNNDLINGAISGDINLKLVAGDVVKLKFKQNVVSSASISNARFSGYKIY